VPGAKPRICKLCKVPQANSNIYHYKIVYLILGKVQESDGEGEYQEGGLLVESLPSALLVIKTHT